MRSLFTIQNGSAVGDGEKKRGGEVEELGEKAFKEEGGGGGKLPLGEGRGEGEGRGRGKEEEKGRGGEREG